MSQADPSAHELIALARDGRRRANGKRPGMIFQREWARDVKLFEAELKADLAVLRIAAPYVTGTDDAARVTEAIRRLSAVLGS